MKRAIIIFMALLFVMSTISVAALTASEAKDVWFDKRDVRFEKNSEHKQAKLTYANDKSSENSKAVVDTGKDLFSAGLDEVEAWLVWKNIEASEDDRIPQHMKDTIDEDVNKNLEKVEKLRDDVDGISSQIELGIAALAMGGKYFELVTDVARNTGLVWSHIGNARADKIEEFHDKILVYAEEAGNEAAIEKLNTVTSELEIARRNIDNAEDTYELVEIGKMPMLKFAEGNNYLRAAQTNLISALSNVNQAYGLVLRGE